MGLGLEEQETTGREWMKAGCSRFGEQVQGYSQMEMLGLFGECQAVWG